MPTGQGSSRFNSLRLKALGWQLYKRLRTVRIGPARWRSIDGINSIWGICKSCSLPFEVPSGAYMCFPGGSLEEVLEHGLPTVGPCPHCWKRWRFRSGNALVMEDLSGPLPMLSGNYSRRFRGIMTVATELAMGNLTVGEAEDWLSRSAGPIAGLATRLRSAGPTPATAGGLIAATVALAGVNLFWDDVDVDDYDSSHFYAVMDSLMVDYDGSRRVPRLRPQGTGFVLEGRDEHQT